MPPARSTRAAAAAPARAARSSEAKARATYPVSADVTIKASVLAVDGTLYVTSPDNAWAIDARDGRELWHYFWKTRGGTHIATRGFGMWNDYLYMETPDNYLVSLEAKTGKERWHKVICRLQPAVLLDDGAGGRSATM